MIPPVALAFAAVAAKVGTFVWLVGLATDPAAEHARINFLERAETALDKYQKINSDYDQAWHAGLHHDIERLRPKVADGWKFDDIWAASRLGNFMAWMRFKGAMVGISGLVTEGASRASTALQESAAEAMQEVQKEFSAAKQDFGKEWSKWMDHIFGPEPPTDKQDKDAA